MRTFDVFSVDFVVVFVVRLLSMVYCFGRVEMKSSCDEQHEEKRPKCRSALAAHAEAAISLIFTHWEVGGV